MRLTGISGHWNGNLGEFDFSVDRVGPHWLVQYWVEAHPARFMRVEGRTRANALFNLVVRWLDHRLFSLVGIAPQPLLDDASGGVGDVADRRLARQVLADWLVDNGQEEWLRETIRQGEEAGVEWPVGWSEIARRYA